MRYFLSLYLIASEVMFLAALFVPGVRDRLRSLQMSLLMATIASLVILPTWPLFFAREIMRRRHHG